MNVVESMTIARITILGILGSMTFLKKSHLSPCLDEEAYLTGKL